MDFIPVYSAKLGGNEENYVLDCIRSSWISSRGSYIAKFESVFSEFTKISYSSTVSNGTVALHLALLALGIKENDEVILPSFTYIASVNAVKYVNAIPVFVDSEDKYWQINTGKIEEKITPKTKAIMAVHLYGHPCEMDELKRICKKYNLFLIEDCAEAFGTLYKNQHVGSFGDISTFSFFGNKTITTGEGGMVASSNKNLIDKVNKLKSQGLEGKKEYWHDEIGYNYRMTNICAAIGLAQLETVTSIIAKKREIASLFIDFFKDKKYLEFHNESPDSFHTYWMCSIRLKNSALRDSLRSFLREKNIETRPAFYLANQMPIYFSEEQFPIAESISSSVINIPSWPDLSIPQLNYICEQIDSFFNKNI
jgi:perosamine synthetase